MQIYKQTESALTLAAFFQNMGVVFTQAISHNLRYKKKQTAFKAACLMLRLPTIVFLDDKRTIDCADGIFKIEVIHADNDVQLA